MELYFFLLGGMVGWVVNDAVKSYQHRIEALEAGQGRVHMVEPTRSDRRSAIAQAEAFRDAGLVVGLRGAHVHRED